MKKLALIFAVLIFVGTNIPAAFAQNASENFAKANSMLVAGKFQDAVPLYKTAIQQNPKFAEAYLGLGMCYKEMGQYDEAYAATRKALQLKPDYYQAYYNLGLILEKQKKYDEAIDAYNKFLDKVPGADRFTDAKQRIANLKKQRDQ